jgi:hypothetical protein
MIEHKKHVIFDEIIYDRLQLETFVKKFNNCVIESKDVSNSNKVNYENKEGYKIVDTTLLEGKTPTEYPEIQNLKDKFKIDIPDEHVDIINFDVGFNLPPHIDLNSCTSIMFPILPKDAGEELIFHDGDKIDYTVKYSTQHPTAINTQLLHSVGEVKERRVYLRFMIYNYTLDDIKSLCKEGELFK